MRKKNTKHCKLCDQCFYRMDHHCLFLLKCVAYNNHARFIWFIILTVFNMTYFVGEALLWAYIKYRKEAFLVAVQNMFWNDCWVFSMIGLNIVSIVWACNLVYFQLSVVSRGHTSYFQRDVSTLTPMEKCTNIFNVMLGRPLITSDLDFDLPREKPGMHRTSVHNV